MPHTQTTLASIKCLENLRIIKAKEFYMSCFTETKIRLVIKFHSTIYKSVSIKQKHFN